jgi:hypothetical protein
VFETVCASSIQNIPDEGHYSFRKVGSALTETENWDLLVDCTSRDGRQMLDAGVHLSDVSSPFVKAEVDSVDYVVLCLKRYVRLQ